MSNTALDTISTALDTLYAQAYETLQVACEASGRPGFHELTDVPGEPSIHDLAILIVNRQLAVRRMARQGFMGPSYYATVKQIADIDAQLAKAGLA